MPGSDDDSLHSDEALFTAKILQALVDDAPDPSVGLLALLGRIFDCRTVAVFPKDGGCVAWGEGAEAARRCALNDLAEPVVSRSRASGNPERSAPEELSPLFPSESPRLAYPLGPEATLYLGQPRRAGDLKARRLAQHLANFLHLERARKSESRQREEQARELQHLEKTLELTGRCLESLTQETLSLETAALIEGALAGLREELPHRGWQVLLGNEEFLGSQELDQAQRIALSGLVANLTCSLALEDLRETPFRPLADLGVSLLASPLKEGTLVLFGEHPFESHHRTTLWFLAAYLDVALQQARLHRAAVETQAQLVQASRMAAVGQLAAGLAHELNNPLGSITLALDSCHRFLETNPKVALSVLANAQKAAARAHDIVTKLLHFSRDSRAGRRACDLESILDETRAVVEPLLHQAGVQLEIEGAEPRALYLNPGEVGQALSNLILNARDAVLEGDSPRVIRLIIKSLAEAVEIRVRNLGPGIPLELQERIFEPFFTTKPVGKGTGLGLSLARQMVEVQGGKLELSQSEEGTDFILSLALARALSQDH